MGGNTEDNDRKGGINAERNRQVERLTERKEKLRRREREQDKNEETSMDTMGGTQRWNTVEGTERSQEFSQSSLPGSPETSFQGIENHPRLERPEVLRGS